MCIPNVVDRFRVAALAGFIASDLTGNSDCHFNRFVPLVFGMRVSHQNPWAVRFSVMQSGLLLAVMAIGLPVIRTSVDHGTAFDIAGTGKADERSLLEALRQAIALAPAN